MNRMERLSTMRLYGASIAIVSGLYSAYLSVGGVSMTAGSWFMLGLGAIVLLHGLVVLTPAVVRLGEMSGPLMISYSILMLLNQFRLVPGWSTGMNGGNSGSMMADSTMGTATMGTDAGMTAIAVLMLASGVIMTARREMMTTA